MNKSDVVIVGAGPAGISLALYLKRAGISFLLFDKGAPGGKLLEIASLENYPGFPSGPGVDLALKMVEQLTKLGIEVTFEEIQSIQKEGDEFMINGQMKSYQAKVVVVATGLTNIPQTKGEKQFLHKGVSYCATCDGPLYQKKKVALYGKGEKALEEALYLAPLVETLYVISPSELEENSLQKALLSFDNVEIIQGEVKEILGENHVESILVETKNQTLTLSCSAIFPLLGAKSATQFLSSLPLELEKGFIPVDAHFMSKIPGLFAIGDVRVSSFRQVVTATYDGASVSNVIRSYLKGRK